MKANQAFKQADEAVSPVIGVILMVAITVVLAAVVFVLVGNLTGDGTESAPIIGWTASESADTLTVNKAPQDVAWSALSIQANLAVSYTLTGETAVTLTPDTAEAIVDSGNIAAGDVITIGCAALTGAQEATITITHPGSGSIVRTETFTLAC